MRIVTLYCEFGKPGAPYPTSISEEVLLFCAYAGVPYCDSFMTSDDLILLLRPRSLRKNFYLFESLPKEDIKVNIMPKIIRRLRSALISSQAKHRERERRK